MKKLLSKFFRVATEGDTTDGRELSAQHIDQMAKNYSPKKYGARVWLEHFRSLLPDSPFKAYGDVVAVKAETIDGKRTLLAQLAPTPDLVAMNQARQKLFSSIEMDTNFAKSGEAYLVGLAVTDSPASLGTEMMEFSAKSGALASRKSKADNLFTAAQEVELEFSEQEVDNEEPDASFLDKIKSIFSQGAEQGRKDFDNALAPVHAAIIEIAQQQQTLASNFANGQQGGGVITALNAELTAMRKDFNDLVEKLGQTPASSAPPRPAATGGDGSEQTDC